MCELLGSHVNLPTGSRPGFSESSNHIHRCGAYTSIFFLCFILERQIRTFLSPPGLSIESQVHIIKWLNKAEEACSVIVVGINSSHCDCLHVGVEFLVINRYCPICRGRGFGLSIAISVVHHVIYLTSCAYTGYLRRRSTSFPLGVEALSLTLLQSIRAFTSLETLHFRPT